VGLPRYFVPRAGGAPEDASGEIIHVLDSFTLTFGRSSAEWIVGVDVAGNVVPRRVDPVHPVPVPVSLRRQVAFHEVSGGAHREIELDTLFLFEMRLLEQAPDCPGVNDPVFLYGALVGPLFPGSRNGSAPIARIEGQLTVTRGDLLAGLVTGAPWAFRCPDANNGRMAYTLSLLTGADRVDVAEAGGCGVLIYPLIGVDADLYELAPGNEDMVSRVLYDVLFAWWTDAARDAPPALRTADGLPVPSRAQHEQHLVSEGFEIKGGKAVRSRQGWTGGLPGFLGEERLTLPPEADTDGFLDLAAEALRDAREWPSPAVLALHRRVRAARRRATVSDDVVNPVRLPPRPPAAGRPVPDWMQSFIAEHTQESPSRLTPGPDDPAAPRARTPLEAAAAAHVMHFLEQTLDDAPDPEVSVEDPPRRTRPPRE
jgi:hypothetical protein